MPIGWGFEVEMEWAKPELEEGTAMPVKRAGHSLTIIDSDGDSTILLFGGCDNLPTNETWLFEDGSWSKLSPAKAPPKRWRHTACMFHGTKVAIFGGFDETSRLNDTWVFDLQSKSWEEIDPKDSAPGSERPPVPRGGHSASVVPWSL